MPLHNPLPFHILLHRFFLQVTYFICLIIIKILIPVHCGVCVHASLINNWWVARTPWWFQHKSRCLLIDIFAESPITSRSRLLSTGSVSFNEPHVQHVNAYMQTLTHACTHIGYKRNRLLWPPLVYMLNKTFVRFSLYSKPVWNNTIELWTKTRLLRTLVYTITWQFVHTHLLMCQCNWYPCTFRHLLSIYTTQAHTRTHKLKKIEQCKCVVMWTMTC